MSEDPRAALHLVGNYLFGGLPFVRRMMAEAMLDHMEDLLPESTEISKEALEQATQAQAISASTDEAAASEVGVPAGESPAN
ncbi:unnamed protein product [Symbiodinium necroappetens]|uniref:Uncharacterized protein n=1 Tax=Symbiodinium necroappetens TaxID=1628268 RepID=A0A812Y9H2_9DINO|nr:unnamed protein product [Symbiodinium necroappetens]